MSCSSRSTPIDGPPIEQPSSSGELRRPAHAGSRRTIATALLVSVACASLGLVVAVVVTNLVTR